MEKDAYLLDDRAQPLAGYPHLRRANGFLFVSGTSARRRDNSIAGVSTGPDGAQRFDVGAQTRAVIENVRAILNAVGADLSHLVEVTTFLVDMADYRAYNEAYNAYFDRETGPARTTVAVKALPHPDLRIEIRAVASDPKRA